jgi:hypothetical protein
MKFKTYSLIKPFHTAIRWVDVPDEQLSNNISKDLDIVFYWGQNEYQPQEIPSLSVGDLIVYKNNVYLVETSGFTNVVTGENV